ncbi:MAG: T9SS type A sorting domain-containing protein [Saprospiraceae bacterium]
MKKIYLLLLFLSFSTFTFSQKEANNWVFGISNLMDFNTDPVTIGFTPNFSFFGERNTVSMSDENGQLLFYSDGFTIFDKNHNSMPNGIIQANTAATHPIFVIPKPGSDQSYYMIINSNGFASSFLTWIEIDLSLNGGSGDVVSNVGEVLLDDPSGKITAVLHSNLNDIWVVSHEFNSNNYHAWLATENGISTTPVISPVGSNLLASDIDSGNGQIKTSHNGNHIVTANRGINTVEIFNFDRGSGTLYNPIILANFFGPYGIELSPTGRYLYVSQDGLNFQQELIQLDLFFNNVIDIANSAQVIGNPFSFGGAGGLQLAPDGKIYLANTFDFTLGTINEPEVAGINANFDPFGIVLNSAEVLFGLPSFFHKYFQTPNFSYEGFCPGGITSFEIESFDTQIDSVLWDFGDPISGNNNTSTLLNPTHSFATSGAYEVTLTIYSDGQDIINNGIVHIAPTSIDLGEDQTFCSNQEFTLNAFTPNATYVWSDNSSQSFLSIQTPGTYWVEVSVGNCPILSDTIVINYIPAPDANLGGDGGLCNGDAVVLNATNPNATYQWSTGSTTSQITIFFGGTYSVTVTNSNGCSDTDQVNYFFDQVSVTPSQANLACHGDSNGVALVFPVQGQLPFSYEWDDGDTLYTNNQLPAGSYTVTITDAFGCTTSQDFTLTEPSEVEVNTIINPDNPNTNDPDGAVLLQPSGGNSPYTFDWEVFGETTDPLKTGLENGIYNITITDDNDCEITIEANVGMPTFIEEISILGEINVFPNPTSDFIFGKIPTTKNAILEISISNLLGQSIGDILFLEKGKKEFSIDVNDWPTGIYFLKIKTIEEEKIWKFNIVK